MMSDVKKKIDIKKKTNVKKKKVEESIVSIEAIRLSSDGSGVGYDEAGIATFVPGLLPGEVGEVEIVERKKRWQRGELKNILKTSVERVEPPCKVFSVCGGCQLQHLNYQETLNWKRRWVEDALKRIGKIETKVNPVLGMENPWRYRNKARLHMNSEGYLGYFKEKTNETVVFPDCLLLSEQMNRWIKETERNLYFKNKSQYSKTEKDKVNTITWRENSEGEGLLLLEDNSTAKDLSIEQFFGEVKSIVTMDAMDIMDIIDKSAYLYEEIMGLKFRVSPLAFLQVNPVQTKVLYTKALEYASLTGEERVWDLYCGIGTITLALASKCKEVIGIEENPYAIEDAKENAAINGLQNVKFLQGKTEERIKTLIASGISKPDVIVLDPPRAGVDEEGLNEIIKVGPQRIVYVSCDPGTLARDLGKFVAGGYEVKAVQPVDMFPWTAHVECVVGMQRKDT